MPNIFWSAAILLICNFISRCLGFVYKILLVRLLGPEGIGITELVSPVYSLALVAASLGVPVVPIYIPAEKHWFRFTPVVFGEPYYPQVAGRKGTSEEYRAIASDLMARIEKLKDQV